MSGGAVLYHGDCKEIMDLHLKNESIDSLITDPPAGIAFMGKNWDKNRGGRDKWVAWLELIMRECYRAMKPGAHGFVWALPRTAHWTATACENAGFEIRDCVTHLFGSGFPKSLDVSKAIDKAAGAEREVIGKKRIALPDSNCWGEPNKNKDVGGFGQNTNDYGNDSEKWSVKNNPITAPSTPEAKKWDGWGTALKPAAEFWWLIRKPLSEKTVAKNVLKWGTGALNIDGCRVETKEVNSRNYIGEKQSGTWKDESPKRFQPGAKVEWSPSKGRFPANLLLSHSAHCTDDQCDFGCPISMLDKQVGFLLGPGNRSARTPGVGEKSNSITKAFGAENGPPTKIHDRGGLPSRFFYCAKPSKRERNAGCETNDHPTVKAIKLMRYLCKMITPPGGKILDPFMGSGTTGIACAEEGFEFIGIEKEKEYFEISKKRILR